MAIYWGPWAGTSTSRRFRLGIDLKLTSQTESTATYTREIWYETGANVIDNYATFSGTGPGAFAFSIGPSTYGDYSNPGNVAKKLRTDSATVTRAYGSDETITATASLTGIDYVPGATASVKHSAVVQARPVNRPAAPGVPTATRVNDARVEVSWTQASSTTAAPVAETHVHRYRDDEPRVRVATLTGAAASWVDTTTQPDRRYKYQVWSWNSAGLSVDVAASAWVHTTPATPTAITASKTTSADIEVGFTSTARWASSFEAEDTPGGGAWVVAATGNASPLTHTSPNTAQTHAYRVRALVPGGLASGWSATSNTVQLLAKPNVPTNLSGGAFDAAEPITLTWQHNPVDSTAQTQAQVQWRTGTSGVFTQRTAVTTTTQGETIPAGTWANGQIVQWQVRTRGQHADWSDWSAIGTVTLSARPVMSLTLTQPQGPLVTAPWTYSDAEGTAQSAWRAWLYVDGAEAAMRSGSDPATRAVAFSGLQVPNGASVRVEGQVQDPAGVWSTRAVTATQTVAYALPATPSLNVLYDPDYGSALLGVVNPTESGKPAVVVNRILADDGDGGLRLVATLDPGGAAVDPTPILGRPTRYVLEASSALPSTAVAEVELTLDPQGRFWLTTTSGESAWVGSNPEVSISSSSDTGLLRYVGRPRPVHQGGTRREQQIRVSATIFADDAIDTETIEQIAQSGQPVLARTPDGRRAWCQIEGVSTRFRDHYATQVDYTLSRIESLDVKP